MTISPTDTRSRGIVAVVMSLIVIGLTLVIALPMFPDFGEDTPEYRAMAMNQLDQVHQPFSSRFLHAYVIRFTASALNRSTDQAAQVVAYAALTLAIGVVAWLFIRLNFPPTLLLVLASLAMVKTFRYVYMPDLFYSLLLGLFFIALLYKRIIEAAVMIVLLFCARESTLMLGVAAVAVALLGYPGKTTKKQWSGRTIALIFFIATAVGFVLNNRIARRAAPNIHQVSGIAYLVGKIPFNFVKNILGIDPWTNTLSQSQNPLWKMSAPSWLHLGGVTEIGIREISLYFPLMVVFNFLCTFGVLLTVLFHVVHAQAPSTGSKNPVRRIIFKTLATFSDAPFHIRLAVVYGLLTLLVAPLIGAAMWRYVFYAWPLFWIVAIWLFQKHYTWASSGVVTLVAVYLIMVWLPWFADLRSILDGYKTFFAPGILLLAIVAIGLQIIAWRSLNRMRRVVA